MYDSILYRDYFLLFLYIIYKVYVTLKLDDSGCRIHSVSDGDKEIVTNES